VRAVQNCSHRKADGSNLPGRPRQKSENSISDWRLVVLVQIDTSQVATDTIDYVATDQNGLTSTSTRTVIIEAPSIVPTDDASTTATITTP
jgi:hypothetical protein